MNVLVCLREIENSKQASKQTNKDSVVMDGIPMSIESLATNTTILPQNTTHGEHSKSNGFATAFKLNDRFLTRFTFSTLEYTSSRFPFLSIIHSSPRSHMSANTAGMLRAISTERFLRVSKPRF